MGDIWLHDLPRYLDAWGVRYELADGWAERSRKSGGFDAVRGVGVHHSASPTSMSLDNAERYCVDGAKDRPIGNGTISRDKDGPVLRVWCAGASNTQGKGGPRLSSRGLIPLDAANAVVVAWEAENNGVGEAWPDDVGDLYVRVCCATLQWANENTPGALLGAGDVFAHFEWAPGRKFDPAGPSRFTAGANELWHMDQFRGEVFAALLAGPAPVVPPVAQAGAEYIVQPGDGWFTISKALGYSIAELQQFNGIDPASVLHPGQVIRAPAPAQPPAPVPYAEGTPEPQIVQGMAGPAVSNLQDVLRWWHWLPDPFDDPPGVFGDYTWQGVINMQQALAVANQNGEWDVATARAYSEFVIAMRTMPRTCSMPPALQIGAVGDDVIALQRFLASNGWYTYALDGQYGTRTQQGVQQLQKYARAAGNDPGPINGVYSDQTRDAICPLV